MFQLRAGVRVEPIGEGWVAYSPASGDTLLLNIESAAVLEVLQEEAASSQAVCAALQPHIDVDATELLASIDSGWPRLVEAGLVRQIDDHA